MRGTAAFVAALVAGLGLVLVAAAGAAAAPTRALPLPTRLAHSLQVPRVPAVGAVAVDLLTGKTVYARSPDRPLEPASNEKLTVTFAALKELGPAYRFRTAVLGTGRLEGHTWQGNLVLKGYGDPTLSTARLNVLARRLSRLGIRAVAGRVLGDESWFDARRTAPGWKAGFYVLESAPLSALVVNRDWYDRHFAAQPALAAAGLFRLVLREHGIAVSGPAGTGVASAVAQPLVETLSQPLAAVLREMDRNSDNFVAEMLLKELGAEAGAGGTSGDGAAVVLRDLAAAGVPLAGVRIVDGSGLSLDDRLTARAVATLLTVVWRDPEMRPVVWAALPVAGMSGTLKDRMEQLPARGAVRAKTGTTDEASALSGYASGRFAFAVLQNGWPVSWSWARKAQDRFATALASAAG